VAKKKSTKKKVTNPKGDRLGYHGYTGKKSKLSVAAFWVKVFSIQAKEMFTDNQICSAMYVEFPHAKRYVTADVVIFRNRYNNGNLADQSDAPKAKAAEYLECTHCHKGVRKPMWGEKTDPSERAPKRKAKTKSNKDKKKASRKTRASVNSGKSEKKKATKNKATKKKG